MAEFNAAKLTRRGHRLLAKVQAGLCNIKLTRLETGDGVYAAVEDVQFAERLKSPQQSFPIKSIAVKNPSTVEATALVTNIPEGVPLVAGYYVREIGIWALDPDAGEILYSIVTAVDDKADYLPAYNSLFPSTIEMHFLTEISNAETVTFEHGAGFCSHEEMDDLMGGDDIEGHWHLTHDQYLKINLLLRNPLLWTLPTEYDGGFADTTESEYGLGRGDWIDGGFPEEYHENEIDNGFADTIFSDGSD